MIAKLVFPVVFLAAVQAEVLSLSCQQIKKFVDGHNSRRLNLLRGQVARQPAASEMKMMTWDDELATKAAKWAGLGKHSHNPDKTVPSGRFKTGENMYWFQTTDMSLKNIDPESVLDSWWTEHHNYTYGKLKIEDFSSSIQIGHYTQMAWSDSTYVGCGIAHSTSSNSRFGNLFTVVCNYGPSGNFLGQTPYSLSGTRQNTLKCVNVNNCKKLYGIKC